MRALLFDSSFVIPYLNEIAKKKLGPARRFRSKLPRTTRVLVSLVTIAEVLEGATDARTTYDVLRENFGVIGLGQQTARRFALIQRRARSKGRRMGENDAWIAATAQLAGLTIVGDDDAAFKGRAGLRYVNFAG